MTVKRLSKREAVVGERLKEMRTRLNFTQEEAAQQVGITKKRLASYEEGRVAIRYDLALRICRQFIISEKWLATGKDDWRALMDLAHEPIASRIPIDLPFGEAYEKHLDAQYEKVFAQQKGCVRFNFHHSDNEMFIVNLWSYLLSLWLKSLRREDVGEFFAQMIDFGSAVTDYYSREGTMPEVSELPGSLGLMRAYKTRKKQE